MRCSRPQIHLKLFKSKTLATGEHPIVVNIAWKGKQKVISTSFSCTVKDWDSKNECLRKKYPNAAAINKTLNEKLQEYIKRVLELEANGEEFELKHILLSNERSLAECTFIHLVQRYAQEHSLKCGTVRSYITATNAMIEVMGRNDFKVGDIKAEHLSELCKLPKASSTAKLYLEKVLAVMEYARTKKMKVEIPEDTVVLLKKKYRNKENPRALTKEEIWKLNEWFVEQKPTAPLTFNSEVFACCLFLCMYKLQGLSQIDIFTLRKDQITFKTIDGNEIMVIHTSRNKTDKDVTIVADIDVYKRFLSLLIPYPIKAKHYKRKRSTTQFLLEYLDSEDEGVILNQMTHLNGVCNRNLKTLALRLGLPAFTLYSARHSYCSILLNEGVDIAKLAFAMGRSLNHISTYAKSLMKESDLLRMNDNL